MALTIKDEETRRLVRELAELTGETEAAAIATAVRERLVRVRRAAMADRLRAIAKDAAPRFKEPYRSTDHGDLLYDEMGLPR